MSRSTPVNGGYTIQDGYGTGSNGNRIDVWVEYYIGSYNIANNTTPFTAYFYAALNPSYSSSTSNYQGLNSTFTVNGSSGYGVSNQSYDFTSSSKVNQIGYYSDNIVHNPDGTKSISISGSFTTPSSWITGGVISEFIVELPTIPRSSSFESIVGNIIGENMSVYIKSNSDSFTHQLSYKLKNSQWYNVGNNIGTFVKFIINNDLLNQLPDTTNGTLQLRLRTYNGGTQIGNDVYYDIKVYVDDDVKPSIGSLILTPDIINNQNILVKGKNKLTLSISDCTAGSGTSIQYYEFSGPSFTHSVKTSLSSASTVISSVYNYGELTYKVTVVDKRGRSSYTTKTITCYDYYAPYFNLFDAYRANEDGSPNVNGSYLMYKYEPRYADVNNTNSIMVAAYLSGVLVNEEDVVFNENNEMLVNLNGDVDTTYNVYLKIADEYGGYQSSSILTIFGKTRIFNITSDGTGIAIGKMAEKNELFECRWPVKINGSIDCSGITLNKTSIFDLIYPIGSIYMSMNNVNPSNLFGGEWEQIEDRFLLASGETYSAGTTGGNMLDNILVTSNKYGGINTSSAQQYAGRILAVPNTISNDYNYAVYPHQLGVDILPPYLSVYMWKRVN